MPLKNSSLLSCVYILLLGCTHAYADKAVVVVPVVNLIGQPIQPFYPNISISRAYKMIPLCAGDINRWSCCPRMHQLLYNEIVDIIETHTYEVKVRISNLFYVTINNNDYHADYWAPRNAFVLLDALTELGISRNTIPNPIDFQQKKVTTPRTITLTMPYRDIKTGFTFSAGTRFVQAKSRKNRPSDTVSVFVFDPHIKKSRTITLPTNICFVTRATMTPDMQRQAFVSIIQKWAHMPDGFIPYVWGGCSVVKTQKGTYKEKVRKQSNTLMSYFSYGEKAKKTRTGLDCTGLITRAAQIVGIPYFYKNSYTIAQHLHPLKEGKHLKMGDLIWVPGHVMVVSDLDKNLLVEARSYFQGYGKVHEIELGKVFKNINTYADLEDAFFAKKPIKRLDSNGVVRPPIFKDYKLLPLEQLWSST
jgi:hypothetical protein